MGAHVKANDPRHGTRAGYLAHRKADQQPCNDCLRGRGREDKRVRVDHHRGVQMTYAAAQVAVLLEPWLALGLSHGAISAAARLGKTHGARLAERVLLGCTFRRGTYLALADLTEDNFAATAKVHAHLTRQRVFSLMAAGHTLSSIPILPTGQWRHRNHVTVEQARRVRDHYATHECTMGVSAHAVARAVTQGHRPPVAWEDPGTLAWPLGWAEPIEHREPDPVVVDRILAGEWALPSTPAERTQVIAQWRAAGRSIRSLERLTGWNGRRYYDTDSEVA